MVHVCVYQSALHILVDVHNRCKDMAHTSWYAFDMKWSDVLYDVVGS
jgi:hypothetical protein